MSEIKHLRPLFLKDKIKSLINILKNPNELITTWRTSLLSWKLFNIQPHLRTKPTNFKCQWIIMLRYDNGTPFLNRAIHRLKRLTRSMLCSHPKQPYMQDNFYKYNN